MKSLQKILIFGGNGFLGSHVVDELVSKNSKLQYLISCWSWRNKKAKFIKGEYSNSGYWKVK